MAIGPEFAEAEREDDPCSDIVTERDRAQHVVAAALRKFGGRQRCRHDARTGMETAAQVGIVGLVAMGRHAIGERRIDGRGQDAGADHGRLGLAAKALHIAGRHFAGLKPEPDTIAAMVSRVCSFVLATTSGGMLRSRVFAT